MGYTYADGQYWDNTNYFLPEAAATATVTVYYQTTTKEYVEFLRDENHTNSMGQDLYNSWVTHGRGAPVVMAQATVSTSVTGVEDTDGRHRVFQLLPAQPNPFSHRTRIQFEIPRKQHVSLALFDVSGRRVRTLVDEELEAKLYRLEWNGKNDQGADLSAGLYFMRLRAGHETMTERIILVR